MSYHSGRISPKLPETSSQELIQSSASRAASPPLPSLTQDPKPPGIGRTVQNLLSSSTPQSARSVGGVASSSRRPNRSSAGPLKSSPLRNISLATSMTSAPSSPERHAADAEDPSHKSSDQREKTQGRKGMAAMMSGLESKLFPRSFSRGRDSSHGSSRRGSSLDSRSPRFSRSVSPGARQFDSAKPTLADTEKGRAIMHDAHNQSDEALGNTKRSSVLPNYVKPTEHEESGERLAKDVFDRDKNIIESSEDDGDDSSSDDEHIEGRGRKKKGSDITRITPSDFNKAREDKTTSSEEGACSKSDVQFDPMQSVLTFNVAKPINKHNIPGMDKKPKKSALKTVIHPRTSYDIPTPYAQSAAGTPYGSEDEAEKEDVHRAQKLSISMSAIDNRVPNRSIRTIIRGNYASLQEEADGGRRRQRKYLVATDLSEESVYALEWTIGTVLREGDTMYAIYTIHEDGNPSSVQIGEGAKAIQDAAVVVGSQTREVSQNRTILGRLGPVAASKTSSTDSRVSSITETERVRAVEAVSQTCVKLLRKTLLQVRIAVEVIHCKSPKLMITEAVS
ncbi:Universal stress protein A [Penicillium waksmanii]|uniref:Universal stress protein A n=1 Tax=Penicillium waksmanii TaxID=69791 RepID=UPI002548B6D1|nr:Universal stress protein A [Penicillium waksmanii]KAJ5984178.1 Universal stress protein A [Penicillium waksmanii]